MAANAIITHQGIEERCTALLSKEKRDTKALLTLLREQDDFFHIILLLKVLINLLCPIMRMSSSIFL